MSGREPFLLAHHSVSGIPSRAGRLCPNGEQTDAQTKATLSLSTLGNRREYGSASRAEAVAAVAVAVAVAAVVVAVVVVASTEVRVEQTAVAAVVAAAVAVAAVEGGVAATVVAVVVALAAAVVAVVEVVAVAVGATCASAVSCGVLSHPSEQCTCRKGRGGLSGLSCL